MLPSGSVSVKKVGGKADIHFLRGKKWKWALVKMRDRDGATQPLVEIKVYQRKLNSKESERVTIKKEWKKEREKGKEMGECIGWVGTSVTADESETLLILTQASNCCHATFPGVSVGLHFSLKMAQWRSNKGEKFLLTGRRLSENKVKTNKVPEIVLRLHTTLKRFYIRTKSPLKHKRPVPPVLGSFLESFLW